VRVLGISYAVLLFLLLFLSLSLFSSFIALLLATFSLSIPRLAYRRGEGGGGGGEKEQ